MKTCHEEMFQFEQIAQLYIQKGWYSGNGRTGARFRDKPPSLFTLGQVEFGLSTHQCSVCVGRARDFLDTVSRLNLLRKGGMRNKPTTSDELIARMHKEAA